MEREEIQEQKADGREIHNNRQHRQPLEAWRQITIEIIVQVKHHIRCKTECVGKKGSRINLNPA